MGGFLSGDPRHECLEIRNSHKDGFKLEKQDLREKPWFTDKLCLDTVWLHANVVLMHVHWACAQRGARRFAGFNLNIIVWVAESESLYINKRPL